MKTFLVETESGLWAVRAEDAEGAIATVESAGPAGDCHVAELPRLRNGRPRQVLFDDGASETPQTESPAAATLAVVTPAVAEDPPTHSE